MPSLGTINSVKGIQNTFQPLLLAAIVFKDSITSPTTLLLSTHELNTTAGGQQPSGITNFPYNSQNFLGRIQNQEIAATQALSALGIDITPTVTLDLLDADKTLWGTYEKAIGFKGAILNLYYVFWDAYTTSFTSDYRTIFTGICDPAVASETRLSVTATSKLNMNQIFLPVTRIQRRCPWIFPDTTNMTLSDATALHQAAADDPSSVYWNCGYSYLASGSNAVGNKPSGDVAYRSCDYTSTTCIQNLGNAALTYAPFAPIEQDLLGRSTARYGGITWDPPNTYLSRGYGQHTSVRGYNAMNEGKYNDYVPMGWGSYWIDPVVLNISGDANYTTMDVLLGHGEFSAVHHVIVNDIDVDAFASDTATQQAQIALQLFWVNLTTGDRTGVCNRNTIENSHGDPYGGLKVINVTVPSQLTTTSNIPRIRVLVDGPLVLRYHPILNSVVTGGTASVDFTGTPDILSVFSFETFVVGAAQTGLSGGWANATKTGSIISFPCTAPNGSGGAGGFIAYPLFTTNPAWIIMDALQWMGWSYSDLNIQSFCDAADYYDGVISYNGISGFVDVASDGVSVTWDSGSDFTQITPGQQVYINGIPKFVNTVTDSTHFTITVSFGGFLHNVTFLAAGANTHVRYKLGVGYSQRVSGTDVMRQMRVACRSILRPDNTTGLLKLVPKRSLAEQQSSAVSGSNFNTEISSYNSAGQVAGGYAAWQFTYSDILPNSNGESSLQVNQLDIKSAPNKISIPFTDEDNQYQEDSITIVDNQDITRVGRPVEGTISAAGLLNFDQAQRVMEVWLAENYRGNARFDSGGTYAISFKSTFRCLHLSVGDIVLMNYPQLAITSNLKDMSGGTVDGFLARVTQVKPATNFETVQITLQYHDDGWYVDTFGQNGINVRQLSQFRDSLNRPPFPWSPWQQQPLAGDAFFDATDWQMGTYQEYDNTSASDEPLPNVHATGKLPINIFAGNGLPPPAIGTQGTTAATGGTVPAGLTYYGQLCGIDSTGAFTPPSDPTQPCTIVVPAGANTATLTFPVVEWPTGTVGYALFVGTLRSKMSFQATGSVTAPNTPASITITAYNQDSWGIPDVEFNSLGVRLRRCAHAGVIGAGVVSCTSTTIQIGVFTSEPMGTNQFAPSSGHPYYIMLIGLMGNSQPLPIANWAIASNTGDTFTLAGGGIDPTTIDRGDGTTGLQPGDVIVVTMRPTVGSDSDGNYIQDTNWVNSLNPLYEGHTITNATNATPIVLTLEDDPGTLTGGKVYIQGVQGNTNANGSFFVTRLSPTTYSLYADSGLTTPIAGNAAYTAGGMFQEQDQGLAPNEEQGRELYCIFGTGAGTWYKVNSNTNTKIYIDGNWTIIPDATSVFVVNVPNWEITTESDNINNASNTTAVDFALNTPNYNNQLMFLQAYTLDGGGNESFRAQSPWRLIWVFGEVGQGVIGLAAIHITVDGILAIGSDLGPRTRTNSDVTATKVVIEVEQAPVGANLTVDVYLENALGDPSSSVLWMELIILDGTTYIEATPTQIGAATLIAAGQNVRLDITTVGTTTPGEDLSLTIYSN